MSYPSLLLPPPCRTPWFAECLSSLLLLWNNVVFSLLSRVDGMESVCMPLTRSGERSIGGLIPRLGGKGIRHVGKKPRNMLLLISALVSSRRNSIQKRLHLSEQTHRQGARVNADRQLQVVVFSSRNHNTLPLLSHRSLLYRALMILHHINWPRVGTDLNVGCPLTNWFSGLL